MIVTPEPIRRPEPEPILESVEAAKPAEPAKNPSPVAESSIHNANHQIFHNEATSLPDNAKPVEEDQKLDDQPEVTLKEDPVHEAKLEQIEEQPLEEQASSSDDEYNPFQFTKLLTKKSRKLALRFRPRGSKVSSKPQQVHRTPELEMIQEDDVS